MLLMPLVLSEYGIYIGGAAAFIISTILITLLMCLSCCVPSLFDKFKHFEYEDISCIYKFVAFGILMATITRTVSCTMSKHRVVVCSQWLPFCLSCHIFAC